MERSGVVAAIAVAVIAAGLAVARPHRVTAAPPTPLARTESEIRSLDIDFYERRIAEDSLSAADRSRLAGLYLQRARETGSYPDYERAATLARRSLALREAHNAETYVLLASALLAQHAFAEALHVARRLYATDTTSASHAALLGEVELEVGDYASAARRFAAASADAAKPSIAARLARWYEVTGRLSRAQAILRSAAAAMMHASDVPREQLAWFHYRLGELYLRGGEGVVPAAWVDESVRPHARIDDELEYGYLWWLDRADGYAYMSGLYGQTVIVDPGQDLVAVITAHIPASIDASPVTRWLFEDYIVPAAR